MRKVLHPRDQIDRLYVKKENGRKRNLQHWRLWRPDYQKMRTTQSISMKDWLWKPNAAVKPIKTNGRSGKLLSKIQSEKLGSKTSIRDTSRDKQKPLQTI